MAASLEKSRATASEQLIIPKQAERQYLARIRQLLGPEDRTAKLVGPDGKTVRIPPSLFAVLEQAVEALRKGSAVSLMPLGAHLTTRQAAEVLNVSRPFLIKLLEEGMIPYRKVGTHRRLRLDDVLRYKADQEKTRRDVLRRLADEAEEFGFYDEPVLERNERPSGSAAAKERNRRATTAETSEQSQEHRTTATRSRTTAMPTPQKPGEKPIRTGPHHETGPRGGEVSNPRVVRITPDDGHMPPTPKPNRTWTPGRKHR